jgi:hypothetical protein
MLWCVHHESHYIRKLGIGLAWLLHVVEEVAPAIAHATSVVF